MSTTDIAARRSRLPSLTGLRFLAALSVFFFHITLSNSPIPPNEPINPFRDPGLADTLELVFSKAGYLGVSFFFVLSGFVIAWSYCPGEPHARFWRRRLLKIFPNHLVTWAVAMALFAAAITSPTGYITNFLLLNSFVPDATVYVAVNPPSWTLCSELLFYMSFPFLFAGVRRIPDRHLWAAAGSMLAGVVAIALITQYWIPSTPTSPITPVSTTQFWFGYIFPPARLFEFVLGSVLARLVLNGVRVRMPMGAALGLCAAGYGLAMVLPFVFSFAAATVVPIGLLIMVAAGRDIDGERSLFATRTMTWLGDVSFGFYLVQGITIFYARIAMGNQTYDWPGALGVVVAIFSLTLLCGWALHAFVEMPMMRRWARSRPKVTPAQEEASATLGQRESPPLPYR